MIPSTKHTLRFNESGHFRVLMISDIQETLSYDPRTLQGLEQMMDDVRPDLVIWGGDNVDGRYLKPREELEEYLRIFTAPMESRRIPWMHVFGNHDYDTNVPAVEQQAMYEAYPYCISGHTEGNPGVSNYMVPILAHDSDHVEYAIYAFDSKHKEAKMRPGITHEDIMLPVREKFYKKWDSIRFEQQRWYWELSCELERQEGHLVRAMAVMHVPPHEIMMAVHNPEECRLEGHADEGMHCPMLNSGVFCTMLERGDVDIIAAGHLHKDDCCGVYGGITLTLDACAGFAPKSFDDRRGGRIFDISNDGSFTTRMYTYAEHMDVTVK